jgi:hypothetical protein
MPPSPRSIPILVLIPTLLCAGCTYEREIRRNSVLNKLREAQEGRLEPVEPRAVHPVFSLPQGSIRVEDEEGNITLYAKSVRHLMDHIISTIENDERELFVEQVLSTITREEFEERGLDPGIAFDELKARRRDVYRVFHFMPFGEGTPGIYLEPIAQNIFRLAVSRSGHRDLYWIGIDIVFERGNYKLRWFVR